MTFLGLMDRIVIPTLVIFLLVGSSASTLFGLGLLLRTQKTLAFMRAANRWVSTRRVLRVAELPRTVRVDSRRGKVLLALFLLFGGAFALYVLIARLEIPRMAVVVGVNLRRWFITGVALQTMRWFLIAGCVLALAVAVLILFFPGWLTALEARLNKWYSTRNLVPAAGEAMRYHLDLIVEASPRGAGLAVTIASLVVAAAMAILLAARIAG